VARVDVMSEAALVRNLPPPMALLTLFAAALLGFEPMTAFGLGIFGYCAAWYLSALGEEIGVIPLTALVTSSQWIVGPTIAYKNDDVFIKYRMYVPEADYMSYVVPALFAFILALRLSTPQVSIRWLQENIKSNLKVRLPVIYGLIVGGIASDAIADAAPGGLAFIFFLMGQVKFIATLYLLVVRAPNRFLVTGVVILITAISSAREGGFHDLILWSAILFGFVCYDLRWGLARKLIAVSMAISVLIALQMVKESYRIQLARDPDSTGLVTLVEAIADVFMGESHYARDAGGNVNVRLNQGWIISAVMAHTPSIEPFAEGSTVIDAVRDSLLPRFLFEKREVEVSDAFRRFTGLSVGHETSFGISIVGEAWANFGYWGIAMMFIWGAFMGSLARFIFLRTRTQPTFALWTPLVFLHAVKAETELVVALNFLVKSSVFVMVVYYLCWRLLRIRI
jgi:hypothetical protein